MHPAAIGCDMRVAARVVVRSANEPGTPPRGWPSGRAKRRIRSRSERPHCSPGTSRVTVGEWFDGPAWSLDMGMPTDPPGAGPARRLREVEPGFAAWLDEKPLREDLRTPFWIEGYASE